MERNYIFPFLWMRGEDEGILRNEIEKIYDCGIRSICVEARPHDDFCGPGWWHDMDIVINEAKKRQMTIWILDDKHFPTGYANGLIEKKYPERKKEYLACSCADIFGTQRLKTLNIKRMMKPAIGFWQIGDPADYEERANNKLVAVVALRFGTSGRFYEDVIDLTDDAKDGSLDFLLPSGQWRIHVIYITRTDGGNPAYINMIDKESAHTQIEGVYEEHFNHYGQEFGKTIAGFFSDEPQFGNIEDQCFDTKLGKSKMPLPWSREAARMLSERYPNGYRGHLAFLFTESIEKTVMTQIRYDYMDCISRLYAENFAKPIGRWCHDHGVEYIGHVVEDNGVHSRLGLGAAHWFRAMEGQDMAGIDMIGGQYYFGAPYQERKAMTDCDGEFFHYALGKLGASAGHLDPKKKGRTMCELFGAYGWSFGVRDMKYLLDHLLASGVNHLVPHAFSMAEYPDYDCPPHFYARGNNPEFPYFAYLMKYANRMCAQLNGGKHVPSVAVLYDGELDWAGDCMPMQKVCRILSENQIEYDIVSLDMLWNLDSYNGSVTGSQLEINGIQFGVLFVPQAEYVPSRLLAFHKNAVRFPIFFIDGIPGHVVQEPDAIWDEPENASFDIPVLMRTDIVSTVKGMGLKTISVSPEFPMLRIYHYWKDGQVFMLVNEDAVQDFEGAVTLPAERHLVRYDGFTNQYEMVEAESAGQCKMVHLLLHPGESILLLEEEEPKLEKYVPLSRKLEDMRGRIDISKGWHVTAKKASGEVVFDEDIEGTLHPVSERYPAFSGTVFYEKEIHLEQDIHTACLIAEDVQEVMRLDVNGKTEGFCLAPPYQVKLAHGLKKGRNKIIVEVATTCARDQVNYPQAPFDFTYEAVEATGMFGAVELLYEQP